MLPSILQQCDGWSLSGEAVATVKSRLLSVRSKVSVENDSRGETYGTLTVPMISMAIASHAEVCWKKESQLNTWPVLSPSCKWCQSFVPFHCFPSHSFPPLLLLWSNIQLEWMDEENCSESSKNESLGKSCPSFDWNRFTKVKTPPLPFLQFCRPFFSSQSDSLCSQCQMHSFDILSFWFPTFVSHQKR